MDSSSKTAVAIVASAFLLAGIFIFYQEFSRQRDIAQAQQVMQGISDYADHAATQLNAMTAQERARQQRAYEQQRLDNADLWGRRALGNNQRCVGGVVVEISGSTYTQLGSISNPVRCAGQYADQAIR